ncbi:Hpt domain-containing protein [Sedimenticola selenatireducens]|uniref:Hpt domain-containing protein n=1 Tax=Sedimenticola selenatireducens TaxID=191960 RepID=UPI0023566628|nr:Hpt domain-containing protein [Sedimenticola selenatireducens]
MATQPLMDRAEALAQPGRAAAVPTSDDAVGGVDEPLTSEEKLDALEDEISADESLEFTASDDLDMETAAEQVAQSPAVDEELLPQSDAAEIELAVEAEADDGAEIAAAPISMDEMLLEIFEAESRTHIETLGQFHEACSGNPIACRIDKEMVRALHTLHGSAEMAGVDSIAQVSSALESLAADLKSMNRPADPVALDLIGRSVDQFGTILGAINVPGAQLPDWQVLVGDIYAYGRAATVPQSPPDENDRPAVVSTASVHDDVSLVDLSEEPDEVIEDVAGQEEWLDEADDGDVTETDSIQPLEALAGESSADPSQIESGGEAGEQVVAESMPAETAFTAPEAPTEELESVGERADQLEAQDLSPPLLDEAILVEAPDEATEPVSAATEQIPPVVSQEAGMEMAGPLMVDLDGDPELVDIFLEEARELHEYLEGSLQAGAFDLSDKKLSEELQRTLHTLKGGARLAGAMPIGDLSHGFESLLTAVDQEKVATGDQLVKLTHEVVDRLAEQIDDLSGGPRLRVADDLVQKMDEWLVAGGPPSTTADLPAGSDDSGMPVVGAEDETAPVPVESIPDSPVTGLLETEESDVEAELQEPEAPALEIADEAISTPNAQVDKSVPSDTTMSVVAEEAGSLPGRAQREQVRVRSDLLDRLVNYAGEVSIYRTRIEQQNGQLGFNLSELEQTVSRLRDQLRQLEIETEAQILFRYEQDRGDEPSHDASFDPLELDRFSAMQQVSRSLMETVNDLANINGFLEELQAETDTLLLQQARITTDLQDGLMRTRMVPFAQIVPRLQRVVRQTSNQLNKPAELVIQGAESEIDRGILERMICPLEHILRNAIAHGIEKPARRVETGKSET